MFGSQPLLNGPFEFIFAYLMAMALSVIRPIAMFTILPIISRLGLPNLFKHALAMALSLYTVESLLADPAALQSMSPMWVVSVVLKEALIGLAMGIIIGAPFWAIEMAGNLLDFFREAPDSAIQDPQGSTDASISGALFSIFATLLFLAAGGLTTIVGLLYSSYHAWPILNIIPDFATNSSQKILFFLDWMLRTAILIASPMLLLLILSFVSLMAIAKFIPQINVFDMSMVARNVTYFVMFPVYTLFIIGYFNDQLYIVKLSLRQLERILNGG